MGVLDKRRTAVRLAVVVLGIILMAIVCKYVFDVCYYTVMEEQRAVLKRVGERVDEKIEKSQIFFQMAVNGQDFLEMSEERRKHKCREMLSYGFSSVRVFDEYKNLIYKLENHDDSIEMLIKTDDYKQMMNGKFVLRGKVSEANPADSVIIMMLAIFGENLEYRGAVASYIDGSEFARLLNKENLAVKGSYLFITDEANFYVFNDNKYISEEPRLLYESSRSDDGQAKSPMIFLQKYFGADLEDVYLDMPIVNAPWHVIAVLPANELFSYIILKMFNQGMVLLAVLAIFSIIIWNILQRHELIRTKEHIKMEKMKMMMQMSASMAHEIKNPLTSLKGFLQYLYYKQKKEHPEQEKFFSIMFDEVDRIEMLANQFCMMAKPDENIKKEAFLIDNIMEEIYMLTDAQAKKRSIVLEYQPLNKPLEIWGNRQQIKQIFINLVNNAFDAVAAVENQVGRVEIISRCFDGKCELEVKDNGVGIKNEDMAKLCTAFYTTKEQGNGLGLMITNELIKQHNGNMRIISEYGQGTSFIVTFPIYEKV